IEVGTSSETRATRRGRSSLRRTGPGRTAAATEPAGNRNRFALHRPSCVSGSRIVALRVRSAEVATARHVPPEGAVVVAVASATTVAAVVVVVHARAAEAAAITAAVVTTVEATEAVTGDNQFPSEESIRVSSH